MTWTWDAIASPDVAVYLLLVWLTVATGRAPEFVVVAETPALTVQWDMPVMVGQCLMVDVEARDWAGNESAR